MPVIITAGYLLGAPGNHPHIGYQTWVRDLTPLDLSVSSETSEGPRDSILRPNTHEFWQGSELPATMTIDLGSHQNVDYVGLAAHTIGSDGQAVLVEYSADNSTWFTFAASLNPTTDAPIMFIDTSVARRYWRITFTGTGAVPKLAVVYIGEVLLLPRPIYAGHSPAPLSRDTILIQNMSDGGHFLGQYVRRHGVNGSVSLRHLKAQWYRDKFDRFVRAAREFPYFFTWRPLTFDKEVAYAWTEANIKPSNMGVKDFMQVRFNFQGVGHVD